MQAGEIALTAFAPEHLAGMHALSRAAGWPHRREDLALSASLGVGTTALLGDRVVGTALTALFGASAAISTVVVDEGLRGRGLGRRLMHAALAQAGERDCRLVATEAGLPLYETLGFTATGRILQHQGTATPDPEPDFRGGAVAWSDAEPVERLATLDRAACGMDRTALFARLAGRARVAVLARDGGTAGFAVLRPFGRGEVIGPVVAGTAGEARALLAFVLAARPGSFLRVDTPDESGLAPWLTQRGLLPVGGGIPMRRVSAGAEAMRRASAGTEPATGPHRTFALASQALG